MIVALDVHYREDGAHSAGLGFQHWPDEEPSRIYTDHRAGVSDYEPGAFYKRELPCLLGLLAQVSLAETQTLVVDGYVYLADGKPALGAHLFTALGQRIPVIGVAKTAFHGCADFAVPLLRGSSKVPLWITATGVAVDVAAASIRQMAGPDRMPLLLRQLDRISRGH